MGHYETRYWLSDGWGATRAESHSGTYHPYIPDKLSDASLALSAETSAVLSEAERAVTLLDASVHHLADTESIARLILRSEAIASSRIEGLEAPARRVLEYEELDAIGVRHRLDSAEAAVLANIYSMRRAIDKLGILDALAVDDLCAINADLLANTDLAAWGGAPRTSQNWIGGNNTNPLQAAYVPPRPELVPALLDDLVEFCNTSPLPTLAKAAVAHAQFETIHPFVDGNGRTGRVLVHAIMRRDGLTTHVTPPVSLVLATDRARYVEMLAAYRTDDESDGREARAQATNMWIRYFCDACYQASRRAAEFEDTMTRLGLEWRSRGPVRANSALDLLLDVLPGNPVVSVGTAASLTGRSEEAARLAIKTLCERGILVQNARNRKSSLYVAEEAIAAFTAYERSLATVGGDTSLEKPARPAPQRVKA